MFFDPKATNHPVLSGEEDLYDHQWGRAPNWFYYWRKGGVVPALAGFRYDGRGDGYWGYYDDVSDALYLCPKAPDADNVNEVFQNPYWMAQIRTGRDGICDSTVEPNRGTVHIETEKGQPNAIAIRTGGDGTLETQPNNTPPHDDERVYDQASARWVITTGPNGRLETLKEPTDEYETHQFEGQWVIIDPLPDEWGDNGGGKPGTVAISPASDSYMSKYTKGGDDTLDLSMQVPKLEFHYTSPWEGIDMVAVTCAHERQHKDNHDVQGPDTDEDGLKDPEGGDWRLCMYMKDTYGLVFLRWQYALIGDNEFKCRELEIGFDVQSVTDPDEDWSNGGKRWHKY